MQAHAARGTCVTFTTVSDAAAVTSIPAASLAWPDAEQRAAGVEATHVLHDLDWTQAVVYWVEEGAVQPGISVTLA